jgi:RNA polymerase sigma-70 factor (ECF subfamily)
MIGCPFFKTGSGGGAVTMILSDSDRKDADLAIRVRKGHRDSFGELVNRFESRIYNFCYQFFRDREIAAETTQETFLRAFRHIKRYDENRKFSTWLYRIARNICIDEKRKLDRGKTLLLGGANPDSLNPDGQNRHLKSPSQVSDHLEQKVVLEQAISQLPEKYRTAVVLFYYQDLPYQEIAAIMGLSLNLVKVRIFRAKKMLLEILGEEKG